MTNKLATTEPTLQDKDRLTPFREAITAEQKHQAMQEAVVHFIATDKLFFPMSLPEPFQKKLEKIIGEGLSEEDDMAKTLKDCLGEIVQRRNLSQQTHTDEYTIQTLCLCIFFLECTKEKEITTNILKKLFSNHVYSTYILHNEGATTFWQYGIDTLRRNIEYIKAISDIPILQLYTAAKITLILPPLVIVNYIKERIWNTIAKKRSDKYARLISSIYEQAAIKEGKDHQAVRDIMSPENENRVFAAIAYGTDFPTPEQGKEDMIDDTLPNIIIVAVAEDHLDLARELDRQGGGNIIIIQKYQLDVTGKNITITEGILYKDGKTFSITFSKPKKPDYFFYNDPMGEAHRATHINMIPTGGSPAVGWITENKDIIRKIMTDNEVDTTPHVCWKSLGSREIHMFDEMDIKYAKSTSIQDIKEELELFCRENGCREIVIKPTNASQGYEVHFFKDTELKKAAKTVSAIRKKGFGVIGERRIVAAPLVIDGKQKDWNLRVFATRDEDRNTGPAVGDILARVDNPGKPVNISISAKVMTLTDVLKHMNISAEKDEKLMKDIDDFTEKCFIAIYKHIVNYFKISPDIDLLGIDIVISEENGELKINLIEVNNHQSGGMYDLSKVLPPQEKGRASRKLAAWIIKQAEIYKNIISKNHKLARIAKG